MKRQKFIKTALTLGGIAATTGLYTWQIEPFWLEFVPVKMPIKNLPDALVDRTLYINRALGYIEQVRFNVRPEITVFELEKG